MSVLPAGKQTQRFIFFLPASFFFFLMDTFMDSWALLRESDATLMSLAVWSQRRGDWCCLEWNFTFSVRALRVHVCLDNKQCHCDWWEDWLHHTTGIRYQSITQAVYPAVHCTKCCEGAIYFSRSEVNTERGLISCVNLSTGHKVVGVHKSNHADNTVKKTAKAWPK